MPSGGSVGSSDLSKNEGCCIGKRSGGCACEEIGGFCAVEADGSIADAISWVVVIGAILDLVSDPSCTSGRNAGYIDVESAMHDPVLNSPRRGACTVRQLTEDDLCCCTEPLDWIEISEEPLQLGLANPCFMGSYKNRGVVVVIGVVAIEIKCDWSGAILFDQKGGKRELGKEIVAFIEG